MVSSSNVGDESVRSDRFAGTALARYAIPLLVISYVLLRVCYLDRFVTTDEQWWLGWAYNVYWGVATGHLDATYQFAYPGMLPLWAGAAAFAVVFPDAIHTIGELRDPGTWIDHYIRQSGRDPMEILVAARIAKILLQALFFTVALAYLRRLLGLPVMALAGVLIAFNPFLSGYDSVLHVDGMLAIVSLVAILSVADAVTTDHRLLGRWALAGMFGAAAWTTRTPGLAVVGITGLVIGFMMLRVLLTHPGSSKREALRAWVASGLAYLAALVITSCVLFPAAVVAPGDSLGDLWNYTVTRAEEGHPAPVFFGGTIFRLGDPGILFYPVSILWRATPVTLLGLAIFLGFLVRDGSRCLPDRRGRWTVALLATHATTLVAGLSASAMKFDRYLMPVYPAIDILAAIGFIRLVSWLCAMNTRWMTLLVRWGAVAVVTLQLSATIGTLPYRLDYYNPVLGGAGRAASNMQLGWGQGTDQVLQWARSQYDGTTPRLVTSSSASGTMQLLIPPDDAKIRYVYPDILLSPRGWYLTDFYALGLQQSQRDISPLEPHLSAYRPTFRAYIEGVSYFSVYDLNTIPFPQELHSNDACRADFTPGIQLLQIHRSSSNLEFYFLPIGTQPPSTLTLAVHIEGTDAVRGPFAFDATTSFVTGKDGTILQVLIPDVPKAQGFTAADYSVTLSLTAEGVTEPLPASRPGDLVSRDQVTLRTSCYTS